MPEGYTHASMALRAAESARWNITSRAAVLAGANGPDMLYCFESRKPAARRRYDLTAFGRRMHIERTGAFLHALRRELSVRFAASTVLQLAAQCGAAFAGGFLLAGVRLLIDLQRWNAQRRTPQPVVERRTHRAFQHALQQLVGEIAAKVCRRRNDGEGADVVGTLARFQQKHREIDDG